MGLTLSIAFRCIVNGIVPFLVVYTGMATDIPIASFVEMRSALTVPEWGSPSVLYRFLTVPSYAELLILYFYVSFRTGWGTPKYVTWKDASTYCRTNFCSNCIVVGTMSKTSP